MDSIIPGDMLPQIHVSGPFEVGVVVREAEGWRPDTFRGDWSLVAWTSGAPRRSVFIRQTERRIRLVSLRTRGPESARDAARRLEGERLAAPYIDSDGHRWSSLRLFRQHARDRQRFGASTPEERVITARSDRRAIEDATAIRVRAIMADPVARAAVAAHWPHVRCPLWGLSESALYARLYPVVAAEIAAQPL